MFVGLTVRGDSNIDRYVIWWKHKMFSGQEASNSSRQGTRASVSLGKAFCKKVTSELLLKEGIQFR